MSLVVLQKCRVRVNYSLNGVNHLLAETQLKGNDTKNSSFPVVGENKTMQNTKFYVLHKFILSVTGGIVFRCIYVVTLSLHAFYMSQ